MAKTSPICVAWCSSFHDSSGGNGGMVLFDRHCKASQNYSAMIQGRFPGLRSSLPASRGHGGSGAGPSGAVFQGCGLPAASRGRGAGHAPLCLLPQEPCPLVASLFSAPAILFSGGLGSESQDSGRFPAFVPGNSLFFSKKQHKTAPRGSPRVWLAPETRRLREASADTPRPPSVCSRKSRVRRRPPRPAENPSKSRGT